MEFLARYRPAIEKESAKHGIPSAFLASVLYAEMAYRHSWENDCDRLQAMLGSNGTYGPGQIRLSTAFDLDRIIQEYNGFENVPGKIKAEYIKKLYDPESNIHYTAKYLAFLKGRRIRFPAMSSEDFASNPEAMALVATEYQIGPKKKPINEVKFNYYGYGVVRGISSGSEIKSVFESNDQAKANADRFIAQYKGYAAASSRDKNRSKKVIPITAGLSAAALGFCAGLYYLSKRKEKLGINHPRRPISGDTDLSRS
ncbi:MAG: hypothetical protein NT001_00820 [Candidatus Woesearchaeota archaeon]|nr:hypothetical protein [Candidatus Woesearchaeota archaeon]